MERLVLPDYGRGIAALIVLLFHLRMDFPILQDIPIVLIGDRWVDFFFVMSGYLLFMLYGRQKLTIINFLKRRFFRLYPLVFWSSSVYMFLMWIFSDISKQDLLIDYLDVILLLNSTNLLGYSFHVNPVSWSISAEFCAYFLLAISLRIIADSRKYIFYLLTSLICLIVLVIYGFEQELKLGFLRGIFGFSIGILSFLSSTRIVYNKTLMLFLGLIAYFWSFELGRDYIALFTCYLGLFILMQGLFSDTLNKKMPRLKIFDYLGTRSFSIYMNHAVLVGMIHYGFNLYYSILIFLVYNEVVYQYVELKLSKYLRLQYG